MKSSKDLLESKQSRDAVQVPPVFKVVIHQVSVCRNGERLISSQAFVST